MPPINLRRKADPCKSWSREFPQRRRAEPRIEIHPSQHGANLGADSTPVAYAGVASAAAKATKTRWVILFLISLMYLICYMDRSNISVAQPEIAKQFGLSKNQMALILSAFTWAYALGQVPAGWLGDRFGPKKVLTVIMSWWSIAAMLTGAA